MSARTSLLALVATLVVALAACSAPTTSGTIAWRDLDVTLPADWNAYQTRADLLSASDGDLGAELSLDEATSIDPQTNDVVGLQFTHEPRTTADDWRTLVTSRGGTIEVDQRTDVGGLPATSLVFSWVTNGVPTRERVVFVPSREIVMLFQPVPVQGQTSAPQVYLQQADDFEAILSSIEFGAPLDG